MSALCTCKRGPSIAAAEVNRSSRSAKLFWYLLVLFGLSALVFRTASADPTKPQAVALLRENVVLSGRQRWTKDLRNATSNRFLLILAKESAFNAELTVQCVAKSGPVNTRTVATPNRRAGILTVVVPPDVCSTLRLQVDGLESVGFRGRIDVAVQEIERQTPDELILLSVWSTLMEGGLAFADAGRIGRIPGAGNEQAIRDTLQRAAVAYESAAKLSADIDDRQLHAESLLAWASLTYHDLRDYVSAPQRALFALDMMKAAGNEYGMYRAQTLHAAALLETVTAASQSQSTTSTKKNTPSIFDRVRSEFGTAAEYYAAQSRRTERAEAINNIGLSFHYEGRYDEALKEYELAAEIFATTGDTLNQARSLQNASLIKREIGELEECTAGFTHALRILPRDDDLQLYGDILNNAALCQYAQAEFDDALSYYSQALAIQEQLGNGRELARTLHGLGSTYYAIGDKDAAMRFYSQSRVLRTATSDRRGLSSLLRAMANIEREGGNVDKAIELYKEALKLAVALPTQQRTRLQLARTLIASGRRAEGSAVLGEIEAISGPRDRHLEALLKMERGRLLWQTGDPVQARQQLLSALPILAEFEALNDEAEILYLLGTIARSRGEWRLALDAVERGIDVAEQLRGQTDSPELRAMQFASWRRFYDFKISLLTLSGRDALASPALANATLSVAEQARSRTFQDYLLNAAGTDSQPGTQSSETRTAVLRELSNRRFLLADRIDRAGPEDPRAKRLQVDIVRLQARFDTLGPKSAAARAETVDEQALANLRGQLDGDTAVVAYWIGETQTYVWSITRDGVILQRFANPEELERSALAVHRALSSTRFDEIAVSDAIDKAARTILSAMAPVTGYKHWIIVPDGALHYVPFAALPESTSGKPAILSHDISIAPSVRTLSMRQHNAGTHAFSKSLLVADPVFERSDRRFTSVPSRTAAVPKADTRATSIVGTLVRMPGTAKEVSQIHTVLKGLEADQLLGFDASRERFLSHDLGAYDLIHVATHAHVDAEFPKLSSIVLSRFDAQGREVDSLVRLDDLLARRFSARLVVLSACDTALGKHVRGEGLMGLSYGLLARGAKSVVASLWQVPDGATLELMKNFYMNLAAGDTDTTALARAARTLATSPRWRKTHVWSAFPIYKTQIDKTKGR